MSTLEGHRMRHYVCKSDRSYHHYLIDCITFARLNHLQIDHLNKRKRAPSTSSRDLVVYDWLDIFTIFLIQRAV